MGVGEEHGAVLHRERTVGGWCERFGAAGELKPQECANMAWAFCSRGRVGASQHSMGIGIGEQ